MPLEPRCLLAADLLPATPKFHTSGVYSPGQTAVAAIGWVNTGTMVASPFHIRAHLSRDRLWGRRNDRDLGEVFFEDEPGPQFAVSGTIVRFTIPENISGIFYIGIQVDSRNESSESNESNNTAVSMNKIAVRGPGEPEIEIVGNDLAIRDGDTTPRSADGSGFGSVDLLMPVEHTFQIRNRGTGTLFLIGESLVQVTGGAGAGSFEVTRQPRATIKPGTASTFTVRYSPALGLQKATLKVLNSDANETSYDFRVRGTGVSRPELRVQLGGENVVTSPTPINLGTIGVGQDAQFVFTIDNLGSAVLHIDNPLLSNGSPEFVIVENPIVNDISALGRVTFSVRLTTDQAGTFNSTIAFVNNDADESPFQILVMATVA